MSASGGEDDESKAFADETMAAAARTNRGRQPTLCPSSGLDPSWVAHADRLPGVAHPPPGGTGNYGGGSSACGKFAELESYLMFAGVAGFVAAMATGVGEIIGAGAGVAGIASGGAKLIGQVADKSTAQEQVRAQLSQSAYQFEQDKGLSRRAHFRDLKNDLRSHQEEVLQELREAQKEADRDQWEMTNDRFQTIITSASVLLAGAGSIIVEGLLPAESEEWVQVAYAASTSLSFGMLLIAVVCGMVTTNRIADFMSMRARAQREVLSTIRHKARQLEQSVDARKLVNGGCERTNDGYELLSELDLDDLVERQAEPLLHTPAKNGREEKKEKNFADHRHELNEVIHRRFAVWVGRRTNQTYLNFEDYYERNCGVLKRAVDACFLTGTVSLLFSLSLYVWSNLHDNAEPDTTPGAIAFVAVMAICGSVAVGIFIGERPGCLKMFDRSWLRDGRCLGLPINNQVPQSNGAQFAFDEALALLDHVFFKMDFEIRSGLVPDTRRGALTRTPSLRRTESDRDESQRQDLQLQYAEVRALFFGAKSINDGKRAAKHPLNLLWLDRGSGDRAFEGGWVIGEERWMKRGLCAGGACWRVECSAMTPDTLLPRDECCWQQNDGFDWREAPHVKMEKVKQGADESFKLVGARSKQCCRSPDCHEASASEPFTRWRDGGELKFINHRPVYEAKVAGESLYLYYADASEDDDALRRVGRKVFCKVLGQFWGNDAAREVKRWFMQNGPHEGAARDDASKYTPITLRQWMEETQLQLVIELTGGERGTLMQRGAGASSNESSDKDVQLAGTKRLRALKKRMEKSHADTKTLNDFNDFAKKAVFQLHTKRDGGLGKGHARLGKGELEKATIQIYGDKVAKAMAASGVWDEVNKSVNEGDFLAICEKFDAHNCNL
jgi:hypothetical protein